MVQDRAIFTMADR